MIKVVRTTNSDYLHCPICTTKNFFVNGIAPIICRNCSHLLPDAYDIILPSNSITRARYHQDEELYD